MAKLNKDYTKTEKPNVLKNFLMYLLLSTLPIFWISLFVLSIVLLLSKSASIPFLAKIVIFLFLLWKAIESCGTLAELWKDFKQSL